MSGTRRNPHWVLWFSSGLYTGYIPWASGTWASALAALLYLPFMRWNVWNPGAGAPWLYLAVTLVICALGIPASTYAEKIHGDKDPHKVVIDEIAGYFLAMFLVPTTLWNLAAAFFIFRLFDVWKPTPIRQLQALPGGWGIMIDDILAGIYTCVVIHAALYFFGDIAAGLPFNQPLF